VTWQFVLTGLLIGTLVGMTGMGGGSLMTPILVILFGFQPTLAVGTDILHGAIFKTVGAIRHRSLGTVHARLSGWMLIGSAPFSLLGVALGTRLTDKYGDGATSVMGYVLGGALLFGATGLVLKSFVRKKVVGDDDRFDMVWRDRIAAVTIGVFGGFIVGLTSVGSGTFFGLVMMVAFPLTAAKIVGTDLFQAALLLWVAGFGHFVTGSVDLGATGWLLIGSIPGVLIGSQLTVKLPERALRVSLSLVLSLSGIKLLDPPGANAIIITVVTASLIVGISLAIRNYVRRGIDAAATATADVASTPEPL